MTDAREALDSLLAHPGWRLFLEHAHREWGPAGQKYQAELDKALNLTDDNAAASQARQVRAGRVVIEQLLAWPADELARLTREGKLTEASFSRRGSL